MEKAELIKQKTEVQSRLSHSSMQLKSYQEKLERLQIAKNNMIEVIEESAIHKQNIMRLDINPRLWKGTTQSKYQDQVHTIDDSLRTYIQDIRGIETAIEDEIRRVMSRIEQCRSEISSCQSRISSLTESISTVKER